MKGRDGCDGGEEELGGRGRARGARRGKVSNEGRRRREAERLRGQRKEAKKDRTGEIKCKTE